MAIKDPNENPDKKGDGLPENGEKPSEIEYKKGRNEIVDAAKQMEAELASELEKEESKKDTKEADSFEFIQDKGANKGPEMRKIEAQENSEITELQKLFSELNTDHVQYNFLRKQFPDFIRVCEAGGKMSLTHHVLGLAIGIAESLIQVVKLSGHAVVDIAELFVQPREAFSRTQEYISQER